MINDDLKNTVRQLGNIMDSYGKAFSQVLQKLPKEQKLNLLNKQGDLNRMIKAGDSHGITNFIKDMKNANS